MLKKAIIALFLSILLLPIVAVAQPPEAGLSAEAQHSYDISLVIYANKVGLVDFENENVFIVESERVAQFHKNIFMLMWKLLC